MHLSLHECIECPCLWMLLYPCASVLSAVSRRRALVLPAPCPNAVVAAAAGAAPGAGRCGQRRCERLRQGLAGGLMGSLSTIMRIFLLYSVVKYFISGSSQTPVTRRRSTTADGRTVTVSSALRPAWPDRTRFDLHLYINDDVHWTADALFADPARGRCTAVPLHAPAVARGGHRFRGGERVGLAGRALAQPQSLQQPFLDHALRNGSLYAHIYLSKRGFPHASTLQCAEVGQLRGPRQPLHARLRCRSSAIHVTQQLNVYKPPPKVDLTQEPPHRRPRGRLQHLCGGVRLLRPLRLRADRLRRSRG